MRAAVFRASAMMMLALISACAGHREFGQSGSAKGVPSVWPVDQSVKVIASAYGSRRGSGRSSRFHKGVDIPAPRGTPVLAGAGGAVSLTANHGAYGRYVVIDHDNGYQTLYAHLQEIQTRSGVRVAAGQRIGSVGKTGNATGYHLHYEVHRNGQTVDPISYLPR